MAKTSYTGNAEVVGLADVAAEVVGLADGVWMAPLAEAGIDGVDGVCATVTQRQKYNKGARTADFAIMQPPASRFRGPRERRKKVQEIRVHE
ncbi:MAG TPA: hypothetical protein VGH51_09225 [Candidatus Angelobacter sp.]|jgi:hypothetical protein